MKKYPFNIDEDLMGPLKDSGLLNTDADIMNAYNFEIDSKAGTKRVEKIENEIAKKEKSLLKYGTWAYYGNGNGRFPSDHYLFWTSLDTNKVGVNKKSQLSSAQQMANSMFPKQQLLLAPKKLM